MEFNNSYGERLLLYKLTCCRDENHGKPTLNVYTNTDMKSTFPSDILDISIEPDNIGYNSQQAPIGWIDPTQSLLRKIVVKEKSTTMKFRAIKGVIIPYVEAD